VCYRTSERGMDYRVNCRKACGWSELPRYRDRIYGGAFIRFLSSIGDTGPADGRNGISALSARSPRQIGFAEN
jgi:hypothetical protein